MMDQIAVTIILSITSIMISNGFTLIANIGKPSELIDKLKRVKLERLEKNAKHMTAFGNHIIKQVDLSPDSRNWRGDGYNEPDYVHDFSKHQIDSTMLLLKLDKLKWQTNAFIIFSILLPFFAIIGPLASILAEKTAMGAWWAGFTLCASICYLLLYLLHSHKVANLE